MCLIFTYGILLAILLAFWEGISPETSTEVSWKSGGGKFQCTIPRLQPYSLENLVHFMTLHQIECGDPIFIQERGRHSLRKVGHIDGTNTCCYKPLRRFDDEVTVYLWDNDTCVAMEAETTEIPELYEFVEVVCKGRDHKILYRDAFLFPKPMKPLPGSQEANGNGMNIIVLLLDGVSHMNFLRFMPNSQQYLTQSLGTITMEGFNKVGENSLPNIIPLLTGQTLQEFLESDCINKTEDGVVRIDGCPFIWKLLEEEKGYLTALSRDCAFSPTFLWENEFSKPPTHHYMRPYSLYMQRNMSYHHQQCFGTRLSFKASLDQIENVEEVSGHNSYFHFAWTCILAHDDQNKLGMGYAHLFNFLQYMNDSGKLNNTALLIMADHGPRISGSYKLTKQGRIEDRMPLLKLILPPWYPNMYPGKCVQTNLRTLNPMPAGLQVTLMCTKQCWTSQTSDPHDGIFKRYKFVKPYSGGQNL